MASLSVAPGYTMNTSQRIRIIAAMLQPHNAELASALSAEAVKVARMERTLAEITKDAAEQMEIAERAARGDAPEPGAWFERKEYLQ